MIFPCCTNLLFLENRLSLMVLVFPLWKSYDVSVFLVVVESLKKLNFGLNQ